MLSYNYLTKKHLEGFNKYKYSAIDTSPLSKYVMHPTWNTIVKIIPNWIAPNLLTLAGFLFMVADVLLLTVLDYNFDSNDQQNGWLPDWVFTVCGVFLFVAYNLDGIDGKQARKTGVSGPLGEMFDHGIDSYIVFFIPFCLVSIFGRGQFSIPVFRGFLCVVSVTLNFYVSHCEKYSTGTLYLPWSYDLSMWVSSLVFIVAGVCGPNIYRNYIFQNWKISELTEISIHTTGFLTTLPVAIYNVNVSKTCRHRSLWQKLRPVWSMMSMTILMTLWALMSPSDVIERDPRAFMMLYGTLFSNIACRLIVAEMSEQKCDYFNQMLWPLLMGVSLSLYLPGIELVFLRSFVVMCILAHIHYGTCVVLQMCEHFKIKCFKVPKLNVK